MHLHLSPLLLIRELANVLLVERSSAPAWIWTHNCILNLLDDPTRHVLWIELSLMHSVRSLSLEPRLLQRIFRQCPTAVKGRLLFTSWHFRVVALCDGDNLISQPSLNFNALTDSFEFFCAPLNIFTRALYQVGQLGIYSLLTSSCQRSWCMLNLNYPLRWSFVSGICKVCSSALD